MINATPYRVDIITHAKAPIEVGQFVTTAKLAFENVTKNIHVIDATNIDNLQGVPFDVSEVPCIIVHKPGSPERPSVRIGTCPPQMLDKWVNGLNGMGIFDRAAR